MSQEHATLFSRTRIAPWSRLIMACCILAAFSDRCVLVALFGLLIKPIRWYDLWSVSKSEPLSTMGYLICNLHLGNASKKTKHLTY